MAKKQNGGRVIVGKVTPPPAQADPPAPVPVTIPEGSTVQMRVDALFHHRLGLLAAAYGLSASDLLYEVMEPYIERHWNAVKDRMVAIEPKKK